jgi:hypothetical protein
MEPQKEFRNSFTDRHMTLDELTDPIAGCVADFPHRRVLVLGDAIVDEYLVGECSRISPEAPVPVLKVTTSRAGDAHRAGRK